MTTLFVTRGLPGAGKTTWAKAQEGHIRVNRDDLRRELYPERGQDYYAAEDLKAREQYITEVQHKRISTLLELGLNVVCDDTNLPVRRCRELMRLAEETGADFSVMYNQYVRGGLSPLPPTSGLSPETHDYSQVVPYTPNPDLPWTFIFDIDGTLALMADRDPYDGSRAWEDRVNRPVRAVLRSLIDTGYDVVFCTGRKEQYREVTEEWLESHLGFHTPLLMRADDDGRTDWIVKYELFNKHIREQYNVRGVFDDRQQVVKMWRALGLTCFQVAEGDF